MLRYLAQIKPSVEFNPLPDDPYLATSKIIQTAVGTLITVAIIYFVVYFILGGINFITSEGDKNTLDVAKKQITYAFFGLMIVFSIFAIVKLVGYIFGIDSLTGLGIIVPGL